MNSLRESVYRPLRQLVGQLPYFPRWREPALKWGATFALSALVGLLSGLAAVVLEYALSFGVTHGIGRYSNLNGAEVLTFRWSILLLPAAGGLLVGLLLKLLPSRESSHGTNQLIGAFHHHGGELSLADPSVKAAAAVGLISMGGSAGPEGPIAALGAAIGSSIARVAQVSPRTRRTLLLAGCGGGVGAIFRTPLGGALFATSILYREPEFEAESMVPAFVSSIVSYSTFMAFWGFGHPMIRDANALVFASPLELAPYLVLGPLCALLAWLLSTSLHQVEGLVTRSKLPCWLAPVAGGLLVGLLGCALPQIMDARYLFIQGGVDGSLFQSQHGASHSWGWWALLFGLVAITKCVASALTVGSSGAGGLLGPAVFIGGVCGAFVGALCEVMYPGGFPEGLRRALIPVGMAGVLSASMRTPMAAIVMVTEMTGSYGLIVPLMLVSVTAYVVGRRWGLNHNQLRSSTESPAHAGDGLVRLLESYRVQDFVKTEWPYTACAVTPLSAIISTMPSGSRPVYVVLEGRSLLGLITIPDLGRLSALPGLSDILIASDLMNPSISVLRPDRTLYDVLDVFRNTEEEWLPVVSRDPDNHFVGMFSRQTIQRILTSHVDTMRRHLHHEHTALLAVQQDEDLRRLVLGVTSEASNRTVQRMRVPDEAAGRSLRESDFRRVYHASVIAIQQPDGTLQAPPDVDAPLDLDQTLFVISGSEAI